MSLLPRVRFPRARCRYLQVEVGGGSLDGMTDPSFRRVRVGDGVRRLTDGYIGSSRTVVIDFARTLSGPLWTATCAAEPCTLQLYLAYEVA